MTFYHPLPRLTKKGFFEIFPSFSFESLISENDAVLGEEFATDPVLSKVLKLEKQVKTLQAKLISLFKDIKAR